MSGQIVVLGMHRSGTSLITGLINMMGAYVGSGASKIGPREDNQKGFFERADLNTLNNSILAAGGGEWDQVLSFSLESIAPPRLAELKKCGSRILAELNRHECWVVKDPRFCLLLPLWKELLGEVVYVLIWRSPLEVARSLYARDQIPLPVGVALWEYHNLCALRATAGAKRQIVSHRALMTDPQGVMRLLHDFFMSAGMPGLQIPCGSNVQNFVSLDLYRQRSKPEEAAGLLNKDQQALLARFHENAVFSSGDLPELSPEADVILRSYEKQKTLPRCIKMINRLLRLGR